MEPIVAGQSRTGQETRSCFQAGIPTLRCKEVGDQTEICIRFPAAGGKREDKYISVETPTAETLPDVQRRMCGLISYMTDICVRDVNGSIVVGEMPLSPSKPISSLNEVVQIVDIGIKLLWQRAQLPGSHKQQRIF